MIWINCFVYCWCWLYCSVPKCQFKYFKYQILFLTYNLIIILIFLLLLSFPAYLEASRLNKVVVRNHLNLLLWSHLLLALLGLLLGLDGVAYAAILAFPLSVSYGQLYLRSNKLRLLELSLWVLVVCAAGFQYYRVFMVLNVNSS